MASASVSMIRTSFGGRWVGFTGEFWFSWVMSLVMVVTCSENLTMGFTDEMVWKLVMGFEGEEMKLEMQVCS